MEVIEDSGRSTVDFMIAGRNFFDDPPIPMT